MSEVARRATVTDPCPVCGSGTKGCSIKTDGAHWCRGEPRDGWKRVAAGETFNTYRHVDDTTNMRNGQTTAVKATPKPAPQASPKPAQDWGAMLEGYAEALTPDARTALAKTLGLPVAALAVLQIGWRTNDIHGECWVLPECDPSGNVIGLGRRYPKPVNVDGSPLNKMSLGKRGLTLPAGWREGTGPIFVVEGPSDVLALSLCGLSVIGRPSNTGGVALLRELLAEIPGRAVYVVGEHDLKQDGKWPGRDGAETTARQLAEMLGRSIWWTMPPTEHKDARVWVQAIASGFGEAEDWGAAGQEIASHLVTTAAAIVPKSAEKKQEPETSPGGFIEIESLAGIRPKAVNYLVPDRIPAGMMGLMAGEGGHGKSVTTLHLAAVITTGRCAFGLDYPKPAQGKALLISCEDDWERTIVPRLAAFGADMHRVLRVKGVRMKPGGESLDFHLGHFRELDRLLTDNPDIRLVVIDPAGAYIGRAGVNENKDSELRTILGPMSESANRSGATILLVKHLNKSAGVSAVQRVSGSTGYVNAVRFAYMTTPDPEDSDRKLMLPIKANVLKSGTSGLAYRLVSMSQEEARNVLLKSWPDIEPSQLTQLAEQLLKQVWEGETEITADAAFTRRVSTKSGSETECAEFIRKYLGEHAHPEKEVQSAAMNAAFSFSAFKAAKAAMRTEDKLDPTRLSGKPKCSGGPWWLWIGTQPERRPDRPDPAGPQSGGSFDPQPDSPD